MSPVDSWDYFGGPLRHEGESQLAGVPVLRATNGAEHEESREVFGYAVERARGGSALYMVRANSNSIGLDIGFHYGPGADNHQRLLQMVLISKRSPG